MGWYAARAGGWQAKAVIAAALLAVVLAAAVPVALLVGLVLMLFGHVLTGLALFGASVLAAVTAAVIAVLGGVRQLNTSARRLGDRFSLPDDWGSPPDEPVVRLRQDEYHYE